MVWSVERSNRRLGYRAIVRPASFFQHRSADSLSSATFPHKGKVERCIFRLCQSPTLPLAARSRRIRPSGRTPLLVHGARRVGYSSWVNSSLQMERHPALAMQRRRHGESAGRHRRRRRRRAGGRGCRTGSAIRPARCAAPCPGASRISGLARMLATIRSNGRAGSKGRMVEAGRRDRPGQRPRRRSAGHSAWPRGLRPDRCRSPAPGSCASFATAMASTRAAGAEVERVARPFAAHDPVDHFEAAGGGAVMAGAEGKAGLDLDGDAADVAERAVMRAVHEEARRPAPASALPASAPPSRCRAALRFRATAFAGRPCDDAAASRPRRGRARPAPT